MLLVFFFIPGCRVVVLVSSLCHEWINWSSVLCVLGREGTGNYILVATADTSLSHDGTVSVGSLASMYGFSLTLDSLSVDDLSCVSFFLSVCCEAVALDSMVFCRVGSL